MTRKTVKTEVETQKVKWGESYISLTLGLIVVVVVAVLIFSFGKNRHIKQTSSIQDGPVNREKKAEDAGKKTKTQKVYIVKDGDDLWSIAVREYGDGYRWVDIAKVNKLTNPDMILSENVLKIPR